MNTISKSAYLYSRLTGVWYEFLEEENVLVRGVQYQKINDKEDIVDTVSRAVLFRLSGNPGVKKIELPDHGLMYHITYQEPGNELSTLYRIDPDTKYVYKLSHLIVETEDGPHYFLGQRLESYESIFRYLQRTGVGDGLLVLSDGVWVPFADLEFPNVKPAVEDFSKVDASPENLISENKG